MVLRKKIISALMLMCLAFSNLLALAQQFTDLSSNYWAYNSIQNLASQNIISGYSDSTFRPENPVTRAEFATMIVKALGRENSSIGSPHYFRDLSQNFWAYNNIQRSFDLGLIKGFPDGTFRPNAFITRTEVIAILASAAQTSPLSNSEAQQILSRFYDANRVPSWAVVPVAQAVQKNLVVNYPQPNFLMPEKRATRAEVAAMLQNLRTQLGLTQPATTQPPIQQPLPQAQAPIVEQISQAAAQGATANVVLRGSVATIQENSVIPTELVSPLNSELAKVGDLVVVSVPTGVTTSQGQQLIPSGSRIEGNITAVQPAKLGSRNASMTINFNRLVLPNGQAYPLSASVATETGSIQAGSLKEALGRGALRTAGGAAAGAALGTALGAITGSTGKGAIYGTAIGGGLGLVGSVLAQGGAIQIPSGEPLFIKLNSPLNVNLAQ